VRLGPPTTIIVCGNLGPRPFSQGSRVRLAERWGVRRVYLQGTTPAPGACPNGLNSGEAAAGPQQAVDSGAQRLRLTVSLHVRNL
jgi:hypothetical protein